jgi:ABC-type sulfate/molybdate transport systems ATPase subunit
MGKSRLLLLEEPFLQLSEDEKKLLLQYIKTQRKSTAIIIAKDKDVSLFDVVLRLEDGRLEK